MSGRRIRHGAGTAGARLWAAETLSKPAQVLLRRMRWGPFPVSGEAVVWRELVEHDCVRRMRAGQLPGCAWMLRATGGDWLDVEAADLARRAGIAGDQIARAARLLGEGQPPAAVARAVNGREAGMVALRAALGLDLSRREAVP